MSGQAHVDPKRSAAASARPVLLDLFCGAGGAAMICKHCGARIERGTMYVQLGTGGLPPDGQTIFFAGVASDCEHEPLEAFVAEEHKREDA